MSTKKDVNIAVISSCLASKSEFIGFFRGLGKTFNPELGVWHPYSSVYSGQIRWWPFMHQGQRIHLIGTPLTRNNENALIEDYKKLGTWQETECRDAKIGAQLDGIIVLHNFHRGFPRIRMDDYLNLLRPCDIENPLSRIILAKTNWGFHSVEKFVGFEVDFKRYNDTLSPPEMRINDSHWIRIACTRQSCLAVLDMLLRRINSDIQDRSVGQTAKHQEEINTSKQKIASSKKAQATDEAEEKRLRNDHAAATKYEEEIKALKRQILALHAENERYHAALTASTTQAARAQEYQNRNEALSTELYEMRREVIAMKAYIAEAERTATGYWGNVEIPPIPYSLEPPRQASD